MSVDWQVTGVVGRAELLSSIFYLWALMVYAKSIGKDRHIGVSLLVFNVFGQFIHTHTCHCYQAG